MARPCVTSNSLYPVLALLPVLCSQLRYSTRNKGYMTSHRISVFVIRVSTVFQIWGWCSRTASAAPCSRNHQREWVVENTLDAITLATAVNCSGGDFRIQWWGSIVVRETFHVLEGTVLNVTGVGTNATMDGDAAVQLFNVAHATLHLNNMMIVNGAAEDGGAISAIGSNLTFARTSFVGNTAVGSGGAVHAWDLSHLSWSGPMAFVDNSASSGGAVHMFKNSSIYSSGETTFSGNDALRGGNLERNDYTRNISSSSSSGGALYVHESCSVSWSGKTFFVENTAGVGGALFLWNSSASWRGQTIFARNSAGLTGDGGAVVIDSSTMTCEGEIIFLQNRCLARGGAIALVMGSHADMGGNINFSGNAASNAGGAVVLEESSAFWMGKTTFENNESRYGGGLYVGSHSFVSWNGNGTSFSGNHAVEDGGAIAVESGKLVWSGRVTFSENAGGWRGGALYIGFSTASLDGEMMFFNNTVDGTRGLGGALYVNDSRVSLRGETTFAENSAMTGGAVMLEEASNVVLGGNTYLRSNRASSDGGGVGILSPESEARTPSLVMEGVISFDNNTCDRNGGGMILIGMLDMRYKAGTKVVFSGNRAVMAGGAIFISGAEYGPFFSAIEFIENTAQLGGGVYLIGSGTAIGARPSLISTDSYSWTSYTDSTSTPYTGGSYDESPSMATGDDSEASQVVGYVNGSHGDLANDQYGRFYEPSGWIYDCPYQSETHGDYWAPIGGDISNQRHPTRFRECKFIRNIALATGGALMTASGYDAMENTVFEGNYARTGGALRLAGTTTVDNCSFIANLAHEAEGPAVSNIGYMAEISSNTFEDNVFSCQPETFLDFNTSDDVTVQDTFDTACDGCDFECGGNRFKKPLGSPMCTPQLEHSASPGGDITVEWLNIERGYWRVRNTSRNILPCYNTDACMGGVTGRPGYCKEGYQGAYCSVCSKGYSPSLGFTCNKCPEGNTGGIVVLSILGVCAVLFSIFLVLWLVSNIHEKDRAAFTPRIMKGFSIQSMKIVVVTWQIMTQFASVANVTYPNVYQDLLDAIDFFNFDIRWILSISCFASVDFHDQLLVSTIGPLVVLALLKVTYTVAVYRNRGSEQALRSVRHKHVSMVLLVSFLVYSSASSTVFRAFACDDVDAGNNSRSEEERFSDYRLRADYRIECKSTRHRAFMIYAGLMVFVYPVGIAALYTGLLLRNRSVLTNPRIRSASPLVQSTSELWKPYKPHRFYYEAVECARRILLTGVVVFIELDSAAQIALTAVMAVAFVFVSEGLSPYESAWDAWVSRCGHVVVFLSMYVALLLKVDVASETQQSEAVFEWVLVSLTGVMVAAVVIESVVIACALRMETREESLRSQRDESSARHAPTGPRSCGGGHEARPRTQCTLAWANDACIRYARGLRTARVKSKQASIACEPNDGA